MPKTFEEMVYPTLADRLRKFEAILEDEPCTQSNGCMIMSNASRMCPACRLRLCFHHTIHYAENYTPEAIEKGMTGKFVYTEDELSEYNK